MKQIKRWIKKYTKRNHSARYYTIVAIIPKMASFKQSNDEINRMVMRLDEKGYKNISVKTTTIKGNVYEQIIVGRHRTYREAEQLKIELFSEGFRPRIVSADRS